MGASGAAGVTNASIPTDYIFDLYFVPGKQGISGTDGAGGGGGSGGGGGMNWSN